jgi:hypothetical protein
MISFSLSVTPRNVGSLLLCVLVLFAGSSFSQERSAIEVVTLFAECYGNPCMDEVADYTTPRFRDNKPKSVWVVDTWKALHTMNYKKLTSSVINSKIKDGKAVVIVNAKISTVGGDAIQKEIFYLIKEKERWLIDELVVTNEEVDVDKTEL